MRLDLLFVYRHRLLMHIDPATRVLSSAVKRSYSQHATQSSPRAQNVSPPPAKRHRGAAPSGSSSARSASKHFKLATPLSWLSEPGSSFSSPRQSSKRSPKRSKKKPVQPKTVLPGPYHNEAYIEKEHKTQIYMKPCHKETPKSSVNNFYQALTGMTPKFKTIDGMVEGNQRVYVHR